MVKERPVLFNGEMVRAILDGRKTQTRRVIKPQPEHVEELAEWSDGPWLAACKCQSMIDVSEHNISFLCPHGRPGDRLWVRETWSFDPDTESGPVISYRASGHDPQFGGWKPSIHMSRRDSRIDLEIVDVRVEQVQNIGWKDALAEGINPELCSHPDPESSHIGCTECMNTGMAENPVDEFAELWDRINAKRGYGWDANPWVWVIEFRRVER